MAIMQNTANTIAVTITKKYVCLLTPCPCDGCVGAGYEDFIIASFPSLGATDEAVHALKSRSSVTLVSGTEQSQIPLASASVNGIP